MQLYTRLEAAANSTSFLGRVESAHEESMAALNKMTGSFIVANFFLLHLFLCTRILLQSAKEQGINFLNGIGIYDFWAYTSRKACVGVQVCSYWTCLGSMASFKFCWVSVVITDQILCFIIFNIYPNMGISYVYPVVRPEVDFCGPSRKYML